MSVKIQEQPAVRVTRGRIQLTLTKDTLVLLGGRPPYLTWEFRLNEQRVRLTAATEPTGSGVTYVPKRCSAIATIPMEFRKRLTPGRYIVDSWVEAPEEPKWVEFAAENKIIQRRKGERS